MTRKNDLTRGVVLICLLAIVLPIHAQEDLGGGSPSPDALYHQGPSQFQIAGIEVVGNTRTSPLAIIHRLDFDEGERVTADQLVMNQRSLEETQIFGSVFFRTYRADSFHPGLQTPEHTESFGLVIEITEKWTFLPDVPRVSFSDTGWEFGIGISDSNFLGQMANFYTSLSYSPSLEFNPQISIDFPNIVEDLSGSIGLRYRDVRIRRFAFDGDLSFEDRLRAFSGYLGASYRGLGIFNPALRVSLSYKEHEVTVNAEEESVPLFETSLDLRSPLSFEYDPFSFRVDLQLGYRIREWREGQEPGESGVGELPEGTSFSVDLAPGVSYDWTKPVGKYSRGFSAGLRWSVTPTLYEDGLMAEWVLNANGTYEHPLFDYLRLQSMLNASLYESIRDLSSFADIYQQFHSPYQLVWTNSVYSELFSIPSLPLVGTSDLILDWGLTTTYMEGLVLATTLALGIEFHGIFWRPSASVTVNILDLFRSEDQWRNFQFSILIL